LHPVGMSAARPARRSGAAFLIAALAAAQGLPQRALAQEVSFEAARQGEFITVSASAKLHADQRVVWEVLSDYDHLAEFIPGLSSSRVLQRSPDRILVEQKGEIGFLIFRQPVDVTFAVLEQPPRRIVSRGVSGDLKEMESRYELQASEDGVRLSYSGRFIPAFAVPPLIGMPIVRSLLERRFRAMVEEIQRREALARSKPGP